MFGRCNTRCCADGDHSRPLPLGGGWRTGRYWPVLLLAGLVGAGACQRLELAAPGGGPSIASNSLQLPSLGQQPSLLDAARGDTGETISENPQARPPGVAACAHTDQENRESLCNSLDQNTWLIGVDGRVPTGTCEPQWADAQPIPFQMFLQGEYIGPHRTPHVPEYRLRVGDQLELVFRKTVEPSVTPYRLNVGDQIRVQSYVDPNLDTTVTVQPDGMITLRLLHQVRAEGRTIDELEAVLEKLYSRYYKKPTITVTPVQLETKLNELRASVDSRFGFGGQARRAVVAPDGTIQLPALGSVPAQGLTIDELKREIDERYRQIVHGMEVTPVLAQIAPRFVYILGEVPRPGRYDLTGPTTVMQALSMAGGWQVGGNLRQIVIFRRTDDWRLMATRVDLRGALYGKRPIPSDELWVRDSDVIVVPKSPVQVADDIINLVFTQGIYRILPNPSLSVTFFRNSIL
ncbi:MAG: hypothetical protein KatS3mg110_0108 [Pirellulaceae bacterium]|nr:MAG: hypothetical protein KatS3mg110_0108 [Pirellulaceae bacterium]